MGCFAGVYFLASSQRLQNDYWLASTEEASGSRREQSIIITHTQQTSISGEYNYETFKPPLSGHISMSPFLYEYLKKKKKGKQEIPTTPRGQSLCGILFFPPLSYIWHRLRCCRLFVSLWFDPEHPPPSRNNEGYTHSHSNLSPRR